jgi:hypothetical protein
MERNIRWTTWDGEGTEHLHLVSNNKAISADGLIVGMQDGIVFSLHYHIQCNPDWRVHLQRSAQKAPVIHDSVGKFCSDI